MPAWARCTSRTTWGPCINGSGCMRGIALLVIAVALLLAYLLSRKLQRQISDPILALAEVAKAVSDRRDYSVRARQLGRDELGELTDAFNHMLAQIQAQNEALRESEGRNRAVVDSSLDAIVAMDHEGSIIGFNAAAERIFGHRAPDVMGRSLAEVLIPPGLRERHRRGLAHYLATGEGPVLGRRIELEALRADGTSIPVELRSRRMPGGGPAEVHRLHPRYHRAAAGGTEAARAARPA